MAGYEQKDGQGALFREQEKSNERAPDYKGSAKWRGETIYLAGWIKEGKNGKFLSLSLEEPRKQTKDEPRRSRASELADDPPF